MSGKRKIFSKSSNELLKQQLIKSALEKSINDDLKEEDIKEANLTIKDIPLEKLRDNPFQPRLDINNDELQELVESIKRHGLLQPIPVLEEEIGRYVIIAGHRRVAAHKYLGKKSIKCVVFKDLTTKELAAYALAENNDRVNLDLIETSLQYNKLLSFCVFKDIQELADALGKDRSSISRIVSLNKLPLNIKTHVREKNGIKDVRILAMLNKLKSSNDMIDVYFWAVENKASREEVRKYINSLLSSKKDIKDKSNKSISTKILKKKIEFSFPRKLKDDEFAKAKELVVEFEKRLKEIIEESEKKHEH